MLRCPCARKARTSLEGSKLQDANECGYNCLSWTKKQLYNTRVSGPDVDPEEKVATMADPVTVDYVNKNGDTGDILFHHGTYQTSLFLEATMGCYFSHTAMLVRDPPTDLVTKNPAGCCPKGLYVWEITSDTNAPVLVPFPAWCAANKAAHDRVPAEGQSIYEKHDKYFLAWRKVTDSADPSATSLNATQKAALVKAMRELQGVIYETKELDMIRGLANLAPDAWQQQCFCSELVAAAYFKAGLTQSWIEKILFVKYEHTFQPSEKTTREFAESCTGNQKHKVSKYLKGVKMAFERQVIV